MKAICQNSGSLMSRKWDNPAKSASQETDRATTEHNEHATMKEQHEPGRAGPGRALPRHVPTPMLHNAAVRTETNDLAQRGEVGRVHPYKTHRRQRRYSELRRQHQ